MQSLTKTKVFLAFAVASLIFPAFMLLATTNTITSVSAVEANGVGVYWDSDCSAGVSYINWGTLESGSVKNITIYIRNEIEEPQFLIMSATNWNPSNASDYITPTWDYAGQRINPDEVLQTNLILSVSRYIGGEGIPNFSFGILIVGSQSFPGDINGDGVVGKFDLGLLAEAYGSNTGDPKWDARCDFDGNGFVDFFDLGILAQHWSKDSLD